MEGREVLPDPGNGPSRVHLVWIDFAPKRQIGNIVRRARKRRGLNQGALGTKAGLRQETVSLLENGKETVKLETILKVLSALDLELRIAPRSKGDLGIEMDF